MMAFSVYVIQCEGEGCGKIVESHASATTCPHCGSILVVENWGKIKGSVEVVKAA